ncbi:hypothetical protein A2799_00720 [Candidatus Roizmanbacteria bacterium RIFCSPHIGHO2_01_FULL_39_24]|uniref:PIN domain-containing protein n=1 Tax=Candidatus Roizmanbacteria bacterium RIFCSPHIGHO2_01_FULL_39_24 TaxID=1802032 RepID=A0A1F7GI20_9BACT|nr:MAG: hypothetical protein A2799_00720 [Candidatus Roizmanbacteria bacterium RIFCSPHIGHO2_01_FULL_39_24]OGK49731.1 MAG: hypothetical protein A3A56_03950 [Candidatus Roizmanbacteria bacterium RIFCSPLOWO2_01_FULL_40_32]
MQPNKAFVVDSSVAVKWFNQRDEKYIDQADKILADVQNRKSYILMPELAKYEVGNALLNKQMSLQSTLGSLATYYSFPIQFVPQDLQQAQDATKIANENQITYYDASFMALAKEQKAVLITDNPKHQKRKITGLTVISLKDYR